MKALAGLMIYFCTLNLLVAIGKSFCYPMGQCSAEATVIWLTLYLVVPLIAGAAAIIYSPSGE